MAAGQLLLAPSCPLLLLARCSPRCVGQRPGRRLQGQGPGTLPSGRPAAEGTGSSGSSGCGLSAGPRWADEDHMASCPVRGGSLLAAPSSLRPRAPCVAFPSGGSEAPWALGPIRPWPLSAARAAAISWLSSGSRLLHRPAATGHREDANSLASLQDVVCERAAVVFQRCDKSREQVSGAAPYLCAPVPRTRDPEWPLAGRAELGLA